MSSLKERFAYNSAVFLFMVSQVAFWLGACAESQPVPSQPGGSFTPIETRGSTAPDYRVELDSIAPTAGVVVNGTVDPTLVQPGTILFGKLPDVLKAVKPAGGYGIPRHRYSSTNTPVISKQQVEFNGNKGIAFFSFQSNQLQSDPGDISIGVWIPDSGEDSSEQAFTRAQQTHFAQNEVDIVSMISKGTIVPNSTMSTLIRGADGKTVIALGPSNPLGIKLEIVLDENAPQGPETLQPLFTADKTSLTDAAANARSRRQKIDVAATEEAVKATSQDVAREKKAAEEAALAQTPQSQATSQPTPSAPNQNAGEQTQSDDSVFLKVLGGTGLAVIVGLAGLLLRMRGQKIELEKAYQEHLEELLKENDNLTYQVNKRGETIHLQEEKIGVLTGAINKIRSLARAVAGGAGVRRAALESRTQEGIVQVTQLGGNAKNNIDQAVGDTVQIGVNAIKTAQEIERSVSDLAREVENIGHSAGAIPPLTQGKPTKRTP